MLSELDKELESRGLPFVHNADDILQIQTCGKSRQRINHPVHREKTLSESESRKDSRIACTESKVS